MRQDGFQLPSRETKEQYQGYEAAMKVMVVDDSNTIRKSVETILSKAGCHAWQLPLRRE